VGLIIVGDRDFAARQDILGSITSREENLRLVRQQEARPVSDLIRQTDDDEVL
jgi:hypothetical protein